MWSWRGKHAASARAGLRESKRRALGSYFFEQICYMFLIPKCRGDWDLGLCTTSGLAFGEPQRSGDFRKKNVFRRKENRILPLRCGSPNASPKVCTDLDLSLLYILTSGTYSKFARKKQFPSARRLLSAALLEHWPQVCRVKMTCTKLPTNCFASTRKISMKCAVNWIPLRIFVRSRNTQTHLKRKKQLAHIIRTRSTAYI